MGPDNQCTNFSLDGLDILLDSTRIIVELPAKTRRLVTRHSNPD
jgi:hypothetical protein